MTQLDEATKLLHQARDLIQRFQSPDHTVEASEALNFLADSESFIACGLGEKPVYLEGRPTGRQSFIDISLERAEDRGITAAVQGKPYGSNPYGRVTQPAHHLRWSTGHNGMRARLLDERNQ